MVSLGDLADPVATINSSSTPTEELALCEVAYKAYFVKSNKCRTFVPAKPKKEVWVSG